MIEIKKNLWYTMIKKEDGDLMKGERMKRAKMKREKKIFIVYAISVFLFMQYAFFYPYTPIGAIRWAVFWNGFLVKAYTVKAEYIPPEELEKITDLPYHDFTDDHLFYRITSPELKNRAFGKKMQYWIVTKKENGSYYCAYTGY